jgi:hypothetical protein
MKVSKWILLIVVIAISFIFLIWYFGIGGFLAGIFEALLLIVLANPLEAMSVTASTFKRLRGVHFFFEKYAVEKRLESTIGLSSKKINEDGVEILPHGVDIKWEESKDREAFLKENKIVVCLEPSQNEARNLARATMLYTSADLIRESQRFIDHRVLKSACFAVGRKMLMMDRRLDAFKCLNEEFLVPEVARFPSIEGYVNVMEKLDSEGNFTRLLMRELSELGAKLSAVLSDPRAVAETLSFLEIMKRLSEKERGVDVSPDHRGEIIDFAIILIAREGVIDPTPYIKYAKTCWDEGLPRLYILAQGKKINVARATVLGIKTDGIYRVETESKFWVPQKKGGYEGYIAVLSRISK